MLETLLTLRVNEYYVAVFFWNTFLALLPCLIAYRLGKGYYLKKWGNISRSNQVLFVLSFLVWFFFFPNTAYLFADIRHLSEYCDFPNYYRSCPEQAWVVPLFFSYALVGLPTFYYALHKMSAILGKLFGKWTRRIFPVIMIPITAMGLLLGLVERFNSWEIVTRPLDIIRTVLSYFQDEIMLINLAAYTLMLYAIYFVTRFLTQND